MFSLNIKNSAFLLIIALITFPAFGQNFTFYSEDSVQTANYNIDGNIFYVYFENTLDEPNTLTFDFDTTGIGEWPYAWCVEYCFPPWIFNSSLWLPAGEDSVLTVDFYPDSTMPQTEGHLSISAYSDLEPEIVQTLSFTVYTALSADEPEVDLSTNSFRIDPPYPNPFNPNLAFNYHIDNAENISITVYNSVGQTVRQLFQGTQTPGSHKVVWDGFDLSGRDVPGAVYYISLQGENQSQTVKAVKVK